MGWSIKMRQTRVTGFLWPQNGRSDVIISAIVNLSHWQPLTWQYLSLLCTLDKNIYRCWKESISFYASGTTPGLNCSPTQMGLINKALKKAMRVCSNLFFSIIFQFAAARSTEKWLLNERMTVLYTILLALLNKPTKMVMKLNIYIEHLQNIS